MHPVRPWLVVGTLRETRDRLLLNAVGIGAMLQLADEAPQPGIATLFLPIEDIPYFQTLPSRLVP